MINVHLFCSLVDIDKSPEATEFIAAVAYSQLSSSDSITFGEIERLMDEQIDILAFPPAGPLMHFRIGTGGEPEGRLMLP